MVGLNDRQLYSMPENVIGLKKTNSSNELAMIYSKADIFINPTYDDNYPTVNLEAVACGTPVITYNTGGSGEFIKEHNAGNVVKKGSFKDLIESIKAYYTKNKKITISKKTIDSLDNSLYKEYLNIYKETLKRN